MAQYYHMAYSSVPCWKRKCDILIILTTDELISFGFEYVNKNLFDY